MAQSIDNSGISFDASQAGSGFGSTGLLKPLLFGGLAALTALGSAAYGEWTLAPTLVLATIAGIDGLFLAAYLQGRNG